jgi:predicted transcriptional regulator of viral defense system
MKNEEKILAMFKGKGVLRVKDVRKKGINPEYLRRLCKKGRVQRVSRGLYIRPDTEISANIGLAQVAEWVPRGVICLLSALQFHDIGTQSPFEVWIALGRDVRRPSIDYPPLRIMRFSGKAFNEGIEVHSVEGVTVRIYSPAKTVADCFKYRNKIGLDVAIEALGDCLKSKKCTYADLWKYAKVCRVTKVMKPYLETIS